MVGSIRFLSDNVARTHPRIREAVERVEDDVHAPYGDDDASECTLERWRGHFGKDARVTYVPSGTAGNVVALAALQPRHEHVLCAPHAHVLRDEYEAPSRLAHVTLLPTEGLAVGSCPEQIACTLDDMLKHGQRYAISVSQPDEHGRVYSDEERFALGRIARAYFAPVHVDGARLGLAARGHETLGDAVAGLSPDVVTITGTKAGIPFGDVVITFCKQTHERGRKAREKNGYRLARTAQVAAAYGAYLDGTWSEIADASHAHAERVESLLQDYLLITQPVDTNMVFVRLEGKAKRLLEQYGLYEFADGSHRIACGYDVTRDEIDRLAATIRKVTR